MWGLKDGYTLLGSMHSINSFENQPIMYTTRKALMHIVKMGRRMGVTCLFGVYALLLLSTKHVALRSKL
jgi:hypothetical protein